MDITKLFFIQKTYANEIYDCTIYNDCDNTSTTEETGEEYYAITWSPKWVVVPETGVSIPWYDKKLQECKQQYSDVAVHVTIDMNQCLCQWKDNTNVSCSTLSQEYLTQKLCGWDAPKYSIRSIKEWKWACICAAWVTDDGKECINNAYGNLGIECSPEQMRNGTCSRNINKTLGIRTSDTTSNPTLFVQDIVLAATSFVGTLMVIALVVMWFRYVQGGMDESSTGNLKGNIKKLLIWLGLVIGSYTIIRLIQYIARWY